MHNEHKLISHNEQQTTNITERKGYITGIRNYPARGTLRTSSGLRNLRLIRRTFTSLLSVDTHMPCQLIRSCKRLGTSRMCATIRSCTSMCSQLFFKNRKKKSEKNRRKISVGTRTSRKEKNDVRAWRDSTIRRRHARSRCT